MRDLVGILAKLFGLAVMLLFAIELVAAWAERARRRHLRRWLEERGVAYPRRG